MTDETVYGALDKNTPIGRTFELRDDDGEKFTLTLKEVTSERVVVTDDDGAQTPVSRSRWDHVFAAACVGFTDPDETDGAEGQDGPSETTDGTEAGNEPAATEAPPADPGEETGHTIPDAMADELFISRERVKRAEEEEKDAKAAHAKAKRALDECQEDLNKLLDEALGTAPRLPFGKDDDTAKEPEPAGEKEPEADPDGWRAVRLSDLDPPPSPAKLILLADHEPPIVTVGDLSDWQAEKGDFWAEDIKGFGPSAKDKLEESLITFWAAHPEWLRPADDD